MLIAYIDIMSNIPKLYFVTGISGSGKTSVARELIRRGYVAFDSKVTPGIFHFVDTDGREASSIHLDDPDWRAQYKWRLNTAKLDELLAQHSDQEFVFLCGRGDMKQHVHRADKVFLLHIDEPTLLSRLNSPTRDNLFAKDTATQQRLARDLDHVQRIWTRAGATVIDATQPLEIVVGSILVQSSELT